MPNDWIHPIHQLPVNVHNHQLRPFKGPSIYQQNMEMNEWMNALIYSMNEWLNE